MTNQELLNRIAELERDAEIKYENHKRIVADLTEQAERWEDDALRLMKERNEVLGELRKAETECSMLRVECGVIAKERDEARREVCKRVESASCLSDGEPTTTASDYARWCGWDCFKEDGK